MTATAPFSDVLEAVHAYALESGSSPIETSEDFRNAIAAKLPLNFNEPGYFDRRAWDRFCRQLTQALNKLAEDGHLVKTGSGRDILFWIPQAHQLRVDQESARESAREAAHETMRQRIAVLHSRISALGISGFDFEITYRDDYANASITMDLDTMTTLVDRAGLTGVPA